MADTDKDIGIVSCPDPDKIKSCQECVEKNLANCGWAKEEKEKALTKNNYEQ